MRPTGVLHEGIGVDTNDREAVTDHVRRLLESAAAQFDAATLAGTVVVEGAPADQILACAAAHKADLGVIGTHGRSGLSRMTLGSVAESVLRRATVPVLIVKA